LTSGRTIALSLGCLLLAGCATLIRPRITRVAARLAALEARGQSPGDPGQTAQRRAQLRDLLADSLARDDYHCLPPPRLLFAPPAETLPTKRIYGQVPHYGIYFGPLTYRIGVARSGGDPVWLVQLHIALSPTALGGTFEMADCALRDQLAGEVVCEGIPHEQDPGVEICPDSGRFEAPATRRNLRALLRRWSREAEEHFNRDAADFGLPVRYDLELFLADEPSGARVVDVRLPLQLTCGRTPYFSSFRTGWSIPIVAHEAAHFLGLPDEYEALSGIFPCYPKTPFEGSEGSRMGLSMKTHTRLLPLHHYLILRRYHCPSPQERDPYRGALEPAPHTQP